jgi:hypothetical protein
VTPQAAAVNATPAPAQSLTAASATANGGAITVAVQNRKIAFARDLFNFRVFLESRIAQPVSRIQFSRRRLVFALQLGIAVFAMVFAIGTTRAWTRLSNLRSPLHGSAERSFG